MIVTLSRKCPICGLVTTMEVDKESFESWKSGTTLIQKAFPTLTPNQREIIQTGIHQSCWDAAIADREEA